MMSAELSELRKEVLSRLKTIRGHVSGIERMVEEQKPCTDILIQVIAVRSALNKTGELVIRNYFDTCWQEMEAAGNKDPKQVTAEILQLALEFMR